MSNVFIIINEWVDSKGLEGAEVTGGKYFTSEGGAWDALRDIATAYDEELQRHETSLQFENPEPHIKYEEYYIQELTNGDN